MCIYGGDLLEILKADYVGMLNCANDLSHHVIRLRDEIEKLKFVLNDIDIFWKGEANAEFHLALNKDFVVMEALCLKMKYSSKMIKDAVNEYVDVENIINQMIGGI